MAKVTVQGPADPGKEGGLKFTVDVNDDCVLPAKDSFVAAHKAKYSRTYEADTFDLSHQGSILDDYFCGLTSLRPSSVRVHRPRGIKRMPEIYVRESKMKRSNTLYDLDMPSEDLYSYYYSFFHDLIKFPLASVLGAGLLFVIALNVMLLGKRRSKPKVAVVESPVKRIRISKAKETKKVNINGVYRQINRTYWIREDEELPICEIRREKRGPWEFCDEEGSVLAIAVGNTADTRPSPKNVATWKWRDSRRPGEFALKIIVER